MSPSPPQEPLDIRAKSLTPQSPKPLLFPSPSNIPILERQMDADIHVSLPATEAAPATPPAVNQVGHLELENLANPDSSLYVGSAKHDAAALRSDSLAHAIRDSSSSSSSGNALHVGLDQAQLAYLNAAINGDSSSSNSLANAPDNLDASASLSNTSNVHPVDNTESVGYYASNGSNTTGPANDDKASAIHAGVNIQALLETLSPTVSTHALPIPSTSENSTNRVDLAPPSATALPPRPPPQEKPSTHPNYSPGDDIRSYHPGGHSPSIASHLIQNVSSNPMHLSATNAATQLNTPFPHPLSSSAASSISPAEDEDGPFPPDLEREFDQFIRDERANVAEGNWDKFPDGSRLFIGNLPTEKVVKRDVFRRFRRYGKLGQISLKQAYGFVQFLDVDSCSRARDAEQDKPLKGRKMHLEISRPQNKGNRDRNGRRRSRSPDRDRSRNDRYTGSVTSPRDRDLRRGRDDYRPGRSPSPRAHRRGRTPDHYDGRRQTRSRSPANRNRYRDYRRDSDDEDLPLPHRRPQDVPDIQILVVDDLDRQFIAYVENIFKDRGVRCDVLILSPRLSESAVVRRQILEGVLAVVRLTRASMSTGKLSMQLFNHGGGAGNVNFEQYEGLDPAVSVELVLRAKTARSSSTATAYPPASYGIPANYGMSQTTSLSQAPVTGDLSSILSQLGSRPDLQGLLANLQSQLPAGAGTTATLNPDIAHYLSGTSNQILQGYSQSGQPLDLASILASQSSNSVVPQSNMAGIQQQPAAPPGSTQQPDMQQIMAQLARYQR